jgi:hypothetical protein
MTDDPDTLQLLDELDIEWVKLWREKLNGNIHKRL